MTGVTVRVFGVDLGLWHVLQHRLEQRRHVRLLRVVNELGGVTRHVVESGLLAVVFTGAALTAALLFGRSLRKDSERLLVAVRQVGDGNFQPAAMTSRADELALVATGINEMASGLLLRERIREAFGRFVSPQVDQIGRASCRERV